MRPLYEIDNEILQCCIDNETGEIVDEERLAELEMERDKKIEGVALWYKDLVAEAKAVRAEAQELTQRARVTENKAEQLKKWISFALNGEKFKTERCNVTYRKSSKVIIDNPGKVPAAFWKEITEDWISKKAVGDAIKEGKDIAGAHIEENQGISIK